MKLQDKYNTLFEQYGLTTKLRIAHFLSQVEHESGLKPVAENLNYSGDGLFRTFHKYFPNLASTNGYKRNPEKTANKVYANRMGNGNEASGEGWKYRGRGFIQITGKENYHRLANDTDLDCLKNPDLLLEEANALISALWFWKVKKLNALSDKNDIIGITKVINGGTIGLDDRKRLLQKYLDEK